MKDIIQRWQNMCEEEKALLLQKWTCVTTCVLCINSWLLWSEVAVCFLRFAYVLRWCSVVSSDGPAAMAPNATLSCLKLIITFYCLVFIILSISALLYATRLFGVLNDQWPMIRSDFQLIVIIASGTATLVFLIGHIGAVFESILCLMIFGAIISYLFVLVLGALMYIIILMYLRSTPNKTIITTLCAGLAICAVHAIMAVAPFLLAKVLRTEKEEKVAAHRKMLKQFNGYGPFTTSTSSYSSRVYPRVAVADIENCRFPVVRLWIKRPQRAHYN